MQFILSWFILLTHICVTRPQCDLNRLFIHWGRGWIYQFCGSLISICCQDFVKDLTKRLIVHSSGGVWFLALHRCCTCRVLIADPHDNRLAVAVELGADRVINVTREDLQEVSCSRWRHSMETLPALVVLCERNPSVTGGFPHKGPVMQSFDVLFVVNRNNGRAFGDLRRHDAQECEFVVLRQRPLYFNK